MVKYLLIILLSNTNAYTTDGKVYDSLSECDDAGQEVIRHQPGLSYICFPQVHSQRYARNEEVSI